MDEIALTDLTFQTKMIASNKASSLGLARAGGPHEKVKNVPREQAEAANG